MAAIDFSSHFDRRDPPPCDVTAATRKMTTSTVRDAVGRLSDLPFDVRVMFSKRPSPGAGMDVLREYGFGPLGRGDLAWLRWPLEL